MGWVLACVRELIIVMSVTTESDGEDRGIRSVRYSHAGLTRRCTRRRMYGVNHSALVTRAEDASQ